MPVSKKDYEAIAAAVKDAANEARYCIALQADRKAAEIAISAVAKNLSDALAKGNPRFDRAKFFAACI
jgi:hypothetical protein